MCSSVNAAQNTPAHRRRKCGYHKGALRRCNAAWKSSGGSIAGRHVTAGIGTNIDAGGACCLVLCLHKTALATRTACIEHRRCSPGKLPGSLAANGCTQGREGVGGRADDMTCERTGSAGCVTILPYSVPHTSREGSRSCSARRLRQQQSNRDAGGEHQQVLTLAA